SFLHGCPRQSVLVVGEPMTQTGDRVAPFLGKCGVVLTANDRFHLTLEIPLLGRQQAERERPTDDAARVREAVGGCLGGLGGVCRVLLGLVDIGAIRGGWTARAVLRRRVCPRAVVSRIGGYAHAVAGAGIAVGHVGILGLRAIVSIAAAIPHG